MTYMEFRNQFDNVEDFKKAYGALSMEEAKALIDAEPHATFIKAAMITLWRSANIDYRLGNVRVNYREADGLWITFNEDDSEFDGNDFSYTCLLDAENAGRFIKQIPEYWGGDDPEDIAESNIKKWLVENINCSNSGNGLDLIEAWTAMGLHGSRTVHEDYPGGIHRKEVF